MPKGVPKRKTERAPAVDRLAKPVGGAILAMVAYFVVKGLNSEIPRVDVNDELFLREVFFGEGVGNNYAVLCHDETSNVPVSSVFQDAKDDGSAPAEFLLLNCDHVLPDSGKTVAERFELNTKKRPTIFVSGRNGPPQQIPEKVLKTGAMLNKALRSKLEPRTVKIENTKQLKTLCLNKDVCALFLKGGVPVDRRTKDAMADLITTRPDVVFASVDSSALLLTNLEDHLPMYSKGRHRFLTFRKVSGGLEAGDDATTSDGDDDAAATSSEKRKRSGRLITSVANYAGNDYSYDALNAFVNGVRNGSVEAKKLSSLPVVKTRTKKLEEQERQKRARAQERERRKREGDAGGSQQQQQSGRFEEGSKEARKEDRDRRRREHLANQGKQHRERTPEEIAEIERKRRQRMEEEAEKWNMKPDDAPDEGDPVDEDGEGGSFFEEDGEDDQDVGDDGDDEDDEDVLDLD